MRIVNAQGYDEPRDAISHDWINFLQAEGFTPLLVPNRLADPVGFVQRAGISALILSNGENVHPSRYNGSSSSRGCSPERDETEAQLLEWALATEQHVLAVCRGFQFVNVMQGGRLIDDIGKEVAGAVNHVATDHAVEITDPAVCERTGGNVGCVNSFHCQGVTDQTLGARLTTFARAGDGVIEGFYMQDHPVLGIEWHPERPGPDSYCQRKLAVQFLNEGAWWMQ